MMADCSFAVVVRGDGRKRSQMQEGGRIHCWDSLLMVQLTWRSVTELETTVPNSMMMSPDRQDGKVASSMLRQQFAGRR